MSTTRKRAAKRRLIAPRPISPATWATMTNPQKAVAIAKDAIWRVRRGQVTPIHGHWVEIVGGASDPIRRAGTDDMQTLLRKHGVQCSACALGGAIVGLAAIDDKMGYYETDYYGETQHRLEAIFGEGNLRAIEMAFEEGHGRFGRVQNDPTLGESAVTFGQRYPTPRARFLAIWLNVAANEGQFTP
jgi:hypothetical protein